MLQPCFTVDWWKRCFYFNQYSCQAVNGTRHVTTEFITQWLITTMSFCCMSDSSVSLLVSSLPFHYTLSDKSENATKQTNKPDNKINHCAWRHPVETQSRTLTQSSGLLVVTFLYRKRPKSFVWKIWVQTGSTIKPPEGPLRHSVPTWCCWLSKSPQREPESVSSLRSGNKILLTHKGINSSI